MSAEPSKSPIRQWREDKGFSLEVVCDLLAKELAEQGLGRPSEAKLSRIERDQDVPPDMIPAFQAITGLPAKDIRPDLAKLFVETHEAAQ